MANRLEIMDEELDNVSGGKITYTWNGTEGSLGINGNNKYKLLNKDAFVNIYNQMKADYSDADIIKALREQGIIVKP